MDCKVNNTLTAKTSSSLEVIETHDLSMLDARSSSRRDTLYIFASLLAFLCEHPLENIEHNFVGTIPNAMNILRAE